MASSAKAGTTNAQNLQVLSEWCAVNDVLRAISPRWKMVLLHRIAHGVAQFSQLRRAFPTLSDHVLGRRLAELVTEGLVDKASVANTVPPQIRYAATSKGQALLTIIDALQGWGQQDWAANTRPEAG